jgi:hypothetical protein
MAFGDSGHNGTPEVRALPVPFLSVWGSRVCMVQAVQRAAAEDRGQGPVYRRPRPVSDVLPTERRTGNCW